jgi:hypothetical protein
LSGARATSRYAAAVIPVLLLLALPASGKSEVRRYLASLDPALRAKELGLGEDVQLDDYPYVHAMRRADAALARAGETPTFFAGEDASFRDPRDWGTLARLLAQDFSALLRAERPAPSAAADWLCDRLAVARSEAGAPPLPRGLGPGGRARAQLEEVAGSIARDLAAGTPASLAGRTVVVELSRGGPTGSPMPIAPPRGYAHTLSLLGPDLLRRASVLYVAVDPADSRRKNRERARPEADGSILHHAVPERVMEEEYGCDDFAWLLERSGKEGTVRIEGEGGPYFLPAAAFDNREDLTTFLRDDEATWPREAVTRVHEALAGALGRIAARR